MIGATLDTNVLASGFLDEASPPGRILGMWRAKRFILHTSDHILTELERAFAKPYFQRRLVPAQAAFNLTMLRVDAVITPILVEVRGVATHPEDDLVLATAVSAGADYLVTGDHALLALGRYEGVQIVSPRTFLDLLRADAAGMSDAP